MSEKLTLHALDLIRAYVHYTLCANHWYSLSYEQIGDSFNYKTNPVPLARAQFYDNLAWDNLELLSLENQKIASDTYTRVYKAGKTPLTYPLPLAMSSYTVGDLSEQYPSHTAEVYPGVEFGESSAPEWGY